MTTIYHFTVDITCASCVNSISNALANHPEIKAKSEADITEKLVNVTVEDDEAESESSTEMGDRLRTIIEDAGFDCVPLGQTELPRTSIRSHLLQGLIGSLIGFAIMVLMMTGVVLPPLAMYGLMAGSTLLTAILGAESYYESAKKFKSSRTLTMDTLFTVSSLSIIGVTIASIFVPWLPMMMEGGLMMFGFRHIGKAIEDSLKQKMTSGIKFTSRAPLKVKKMVEGTTQVSVDCPVSELNVNDLIVIEKGKVIPVDGVCLDESIYVYETILTGATVPRRIRRGELLLAGMRVADELGSLHLKVQKKVQDSYLARQDARIQQAYAEKAPIETVTNKILQYFVPAVIGLALLSGLTVGILFNPALAIQCATSLLVSACPCTLGFITPMSIKIGLSKARENGVWFKSGKGLQAAKNIDSVVFDLNGTLTEGVPTVTHVHINAQAEVSDSEFFSYLWALESQSKHPIARAVGDHLQKYKSLINNSLCENMVDFEARSGLKAMINGEKICIGNEKMMEQEGIDTSILSTEMRGTEGEQVIYLTKGKKILGCIFLKDLLRKDAKETIEALKSMGKSVHICTGSEQKTALYYANLLGIPEQNVYANCLATAEIEGQRSKTYYLNKLKEQGKRVAMVGDGGNDIVALTQSDFGVAIKSNGGDEMTQQEADVVINPGSLLPVAMAFEVAEQTVSNIKQNLVMSLGYNTIMLLIAGGALVTLGFVLNPGLGVALMVLQTSLVLLNQYRFRQQALKTKAKEMVVNNECESIPAQHHEAPTQGAEPVKRNVFTPDLPYVGWAKQSVPTNVKGSSRFFCPGPLSHPELSEGSRTKNSVVVERDPSLRIG